MRWAVRLVLACEEAVREFCVGACGSVMCTPASEWCACTHESGVHARIKSCVCADASCVHTWNHSLWSSGMGSPRSCSSVPIVFHSFHSESLSCPPSSSFLRSARPCHRVRVLGFRVGVGVAQLPAPVQSSACRCHRVQKKP